MSLAVLNSVFDSIKKNNIEKPGWSLYLLSVVPSRDECANYSCRQTVLQPEGILEQFVNELVQKYCKSDGLSAKYTCISEYDGTADECTIYKLQKDNQLIKSEYENFVSAIANPDVEADATTFKSAYVITGRVNLGNNKLSLKLVSMQNPITNFSNKYKFSFWHESGEFSKIKDDVLSLTKKIDVIIAGDIVYFLSLDGEKLFNMERAYKKVCEYTVKEIETCDFITSFENFKKVATSGFNPKRFVSFNTERLRVLSLDKKMRQTMAIQFNIPIDKSGKFDATTDETSEKIVKLLCNKGMVDPFKKMPVEVTSARRWQ